MKVVKYGSYCRFCNNLIGAGMEQHLSECQENPQNIIVPCDYCKEYFSLNEMGRHFGVCESNQENFTISCEICNKNICLAEYESHLKTCEYNSAPKDIFCEFCNTNFKGMQPYEAHITLCLQSLKINCNYCKKDIEKNYYDKHINACKKNSEIEKAERESNQECSICLLNFNVNGETLHLLCLHRFHKGCIEGWCKKQKVCPICQRELSDAELQ